MRKEIEDVLRDLRGRKFQYPNEALEITDDEFQAIANTALLAMKGEMSIFLVTYLANWADMVEGYDCDFEDIEITDIEPDYVYDNDETEPAEHKRS